MQKDHLIQLHAFLFQIRNFIESKYEEDFSDIFSTYDSLNIHPHEIHKSKDKQQVAIFELMKGISKIAADKNDDKDTFQKISINLEQYCDRLKKKEKKS